MDTNIPLDLTEVMAELDELGRAKFDLAQARALNKKLTAVIGELEAQLAELRPEQ